MPPNKNIAKNEQSSVKERLLKYLEIKHLNASQFLDMAGLSKTYISNMRQGIKPTTFDNNIAPAFPDLNKAWILYGEGEMLIENRKEEGQKKDPPFEDLPIDQKLNKLFDMLSKNVDEVNKILKFLNKKEERKTKKLLEDKLKEEETSIKVDLKH